MFRKLTYLAALAAVVFSGPLPAQTQPTAAEQNPEAIHISQNFRVPMLNGRLLLPGSFEQESLKSVFDPIAQGWRYYFDSFRRNTNDPEQMVEFMMRAPQVMQQVLAQQTSLSPTQIQDVLQNRNRNGTTNARSNSQIVQQLRQRLNQFEWKAVSETMVGHYLAIRHEPAADTVPITMLQPLSLGSYNFERQTYGFQFRGFRGYPGLGRDWQRRDMGDGKTVESLVRGLPMDEARAQTLYQALKSTVYGPGALFLGVEATLPVKTSARSQYDDAARQFSISKVIFALDPGLTQPLYVHDVSEMQQELERARQAKLQAEQAAKAELLRQLAQTEASGFERDTRTLTFETAGLRIGSPPPKQLGAVRYEAFQTWPLAALNAYFHKSVTGGQVAFYTDDGTATGDIIFFARVFTAEGLTGEAVAQAATAKYGAPSASQSRLMYWWSPTVPEDRHPSCRLNLSGVTMGPGTREGGKWSRQPIFVDPNDFNTNCGIVAALNTASSGSAKPVFAVADTSWLSENIETVRAAQAAAEKARQEKAKAEIEF